jgi:hypothetical protein
MEPGLDSRLVYLVQSIQTGSDVSQRDIHGLAAGREADLSLPCSAEVKMRAAAPSLPIRLHGVVLNYA